jgi:transposase
MATAVEIKVCDPVSVPLSVVLELKDLRACLEALRQQNETLRQQNERLRQENQRLQRELDETRRQSKRQAAPFSKGPPKPQPKRPGRKSGKAHGRHGRRLPPLPAAVDEVLQAPLPESCPDCGGPVEQTGTASQFQTEIPRRPIVRRFDIHIGCCCGCGKRIRGRHPLQTSDALGAASSQLGPDAQAAVVILNKTAGLSHDKIAKLFESLFGIPLTRGASAQIVLRAAKRLAPAHQEVRQEVKGSPCLTPDETGWRVGGRSAWLHAWVVGRAVCYAIDQGRGADALEELIGIDWSGKMTHDGFSSYDRFTRANHQQCLGHILRRLRELERKATRGAVHFPRKLIARFTEAIHLRNRHLEGEVTAEELKDAHGRLEDELERLAWPAREVAAYETLSRHLWRHLGDWLTFLSHPEVEPTNWEAEQAIRPAVVNRKVWGGNRTWAGARAQGVLMSVLQTCQRTGRAALDFVSQTLRSFGNPLLVRPVLLPSR